MIPRGHAPPIALRTWIQQVNLSLATTPAQDPLSTPELTLPRSIASTPRGFVQSTPLNLIGKDQFFGAAGQGPANLDWPVPRGAVPASSLRTWVDQVRLALVVAAGTPLFNPPIPNPSGAVGSVALRTFVDPLRVNLIGKDQFFGAAGQPPANMDWPNPPRGLVGSIAARTWVDPFRIHLLRPFANTEWLNPRSATASITSRTWVSQVNLSLAAQVAPFANSDWPNPRGVVLAVALRTFVDPLKLNLQGQDKFFGDAGQPPANMDWPVPKGLVPASALRSWLSFGVISPANAIASITISVAAGYAAVDVAAGSADVETSAGYATVTLSAVE